MNVNVIKLEGLKNMIKHVYKLPTELGMNST